jgi:hypothetical protein
MASKIRSRVSSASALDIFSISERSIRSSSVAEYSQAAPAEAQQSQKNIMKIAASNHFDSHLNIEIIMTRSMSPGAAAGVPLDEGKS